MCDEARVGGGNIGPFLSVFRSVSPVPFFSFSFLHCRPTCGLIISLFLIFFFSFHSSMYSVHPQLHHAQPFRISNCNFGNLDLSP